MDKNKIERINELARKAKSSEGLTVEETEERAQLRKEYIEAFRTNMRATLDSIVIQEEDGTLTPLKKKDPVAQLHYHDHCGCGHDHHHHHEHDHCCCHDDHNQSH